MVQDYLVCVCCYSVLLVCVVLTLKVDIRELLFLGKGRLGRWHCWLYVWEVTFVKMGWIGLEVPVQPMKDSLLSLSLSFPCCFFQEGYRWRFVVQGTGQKKMIYMDTFKWYRRYGSIFITDLSEYRIIFDNLDSSPLPMGTGHRYEDRTLLIKEIDHWPSWESYGWGTGY